MELAKDILQGFGLGEGTLTMVLNLKDAFNTVLPGELIRQLDELEIPARIINFVKFLTTRRFLSFLTGVFL